MEATVDVRHESPSKVEARSESRGDATRMDVKREFIVERQGRMFVLYAGLLDMAHRQGLKAIRTRLIQVPSDENGQVAICYAEVETDRGTFTGIGDASPSNVSRAMVHCTLRLAETRAKARALRDAVNVGVAALEELGDEEDVLPAHGHGGGQTGPNEYRSEGANGSHGQHSSGHRSTHGTANGRSAAGVAPTALPSSAAPPSPGPGLATPAQVRAIYLIGRDQHGLSEAELDQRSVALYGLPPAELTKKQASDFITTLKNQG